MERQCVTCFVQVDTQSIDQGFFGKQHRLIGHCARRSGKLIFICSDSAFGDNHIFFAIYHDASMALHYKNCSLVVTTGSGSSPSCKKWGQTVGVVFLHSECINALASDAWAWIDCSIKQYVQSVLHGCPVRELLRKFK